MARSTRLTADHRLTIPKEVRESLGWRPGDAMTLTPKGRGLLVGRVPAPSGPPVADGARRRDRDAP